MKYCKNGEIESEGLIRNHAVKLKMAVKGLVRPFLTKASPCINSGDYRIERGSAVHAFNSTPMQ